MVNEEATATNAQALARKVVASLRSGAQPSPERAPLIEAALEDFVFVQLCRQRKLLDACRLGSAAELVESWKHACRTLQERFGCDLTANRESPWQYLEEDRGLGPCLLRLAQTDLGDAPLPVEILGWIHQEWVRRTAAVPKGHVTARRAAGLYYTPQFVVRYMIGRALEPWLSRRSANRSAGGLPRFADPSCGCGFFLLEACRALLARQGARGGRDRALQTARRLSGVDIDARAIAIARQAIWLELAAAEPSHGVEILEALTASLRCADALADSTWTGETGQFDAVVGNPPYRRERHTKRDLDRVAGSPWGHRHRTARMDLWYYFAHRGLELLRPKGRLSLLVPSYWTASRGAEKLIAVLELQTRVEEIFSLGSSRLFAGVTGRHMILTATKGGRPGMVTIKRPQTDSIQNARPLFEPSPPLVAFRKPSAELYRHGSLDLEPPAGSLFERLARWPPLGSLGIVRQGIVENPATVTTAAVMRFGGGWRVGEGVFALRTEEVQRLGLSDHERQLLRPYHDLCDLGRYRRGPRPSLWLIYSTPATCPDLTRYPTIGAHLARYRPILEARRETRAGLRAWWHLHWPRDESLWRRPKIVVLQMARRPAAVASSDAIYVPFSTNVFLPGEGRQERLDYFVAVLNSRLAWSWFDRHAKRRGVGLEINGRILARLPIRTIDFSNPPERHLHDQLAERASELTRLVSGEGDQPKGMSVRQAAQIAHLEQLIDDAVDALYDVGRGLQPTLH